MKKRRNRLFCKRLRRRKNYLTCDKIGKNKVNYLIVLGYCKSSLIIVPFPCLQSLGCFQRTLLRRRFLFLFYPSHTSLEWKFWTAHSFPIHALLQCLLFYVATIQQFRIILGRGFFYLFRSFLRISLFSWLFTFTLVEHNRYRRALFPNGNEFFKFRYRIVQANLIFEYALVSTPPFCRKNETRAGVLKIILI